MFLPRLYVNMCTQIGVQGKVFSTPFHNAMTWPLQHAQENASLVLYSAIPSPILSHPGLQCGSSLIHFYL
jgi:hypothetical protein